MLTFIDFGETNVVGIKIDGKITDQEFDRVVEQFEEKFEQYEKVRLYAEMVNFGGVELKAFFKDLKFGLTNFGKFEKEAVVTNKKWAQQLATISDPLMPTVEVKAFSYTEKEEAKEWITE